MYSGTRLSPNPSRSFVEHHNSPVTGLTAIPAGFRNPPGINFDELAVGRVLEDVGAIEFAGVEARVAGIRARADGDKHPLAVPGERQIPRPVAGARGQLFDHYGGSGANDQVASVVWESDY